MKERRKMRNSKKIKEKKENIPMGFNCTRCDNALRNSYDVQNETMVCTCSANVTPGSNVK